jgi:hypothetical protein
MALSYGILQAFTVSFNGYDFTDIGIDIKNENNYYGTSPLEVHSPISEWIQENTSDTNVVVQDTVALPLLSVSRNLICNGRYVILSKFSIMYFLSY